MNPAKLVLSPLEGAKSTWQDLPKLTTTGSSYIMIFNFSFPFSIASTVSSKMLGAMAKKEGLTFLETLTGFKWMANQAWDLESENENKKVLLAYEEAIGFMCGTQVLDKDGISAALRSGQPCLIMWSPGGSLVACLLARPMVCGSIPIRSRIFYPQKTTISPFLI